MSRLHTPATLADEWGVSESTVRKLILRGELRAYRISEKLLRVPADAIEEYLCRKITASRDSEDSGRSPSGTTGKERAALRLVRLTGRKPSARRIA